MSTALAESISTCVRRLIKTGFPNHFTVNCDPGSTPATSTSIDAKAFTSADGFIWFTRGHTAPPTVSAPAVAVATYKKSLRVPFSSLPWDIIYYSYYSSVLRGLNLKFKYQIVRSRKFFNMLSLQGLLDACKSL